MRIQTNSETETATAGESLAKDLKPGAFVALYGGLGAGKTAFTRGLARGLGIRRNITSPSFTLMKQYEGDGLTLYHFDAYRLGSEDELEDIGFLDAVSAGGVTVCEWAERIPSALPVPRIEVRIAGDGDAPREITVREITK